MRVCMKINKQKEQVGFGSGPRRVAMQNHAEWNPELGELWGGRK